MIQRLVTTFIFCVFFYIYFNILRYVFSFLPISPRVDAISLFITLFIIIPLTYITSIKSIDFIKKHM